MAEQPKLNEQWSRLTADAQADEKLADRLKEQPLSVLKEYGIPVASSPEPAELSDGELVDVSGGMKWDRNHRSRDIIDARGGRMKVLGVKFTLDINGTISSINGKSTGVPLA